MPFFFVRKLSRQWLGTCNAIASGVMLAASFGLLQEGFEIVASEGGAWRLFLGLALGLAFIVASQRFLEGHEVEMGDLKGLSAKKVVMVVGIMTLHSFSEGLGVGVSYGGDKGRQQGTFMTLAIGNSRCPTLIPHDTAIKTSPNSQPPTLAPWPCTPARGS